MLAAESDFFEWRQTERAPVILYRHEGVWHRLGEALIRPKSETKIYNPHRMILLRTVKPRPHPSALA
jgi:hypothetical protein